MFEENKKPCSYTATTGEVGPRETQEDGNNTTHPTLVRQTKRISINSYNNHEQLTNTRNQPNAPAT